MRSRPEDRAGLSLLSEKFLEIVPSEVMLVGCGPRLLPLTGSHYCLSSERKIISWFSVKRWLVTADKKPSLKFLLHVVSSEGNPESYLT